MLVSIISFCTLHQQQLVEWQVVFALHSIDAAWFYYIGFPPPQAL